MSLKTVLKEREKKKEVLRLEAIAEVQKLVSLLRKRFQFESIYICGSILTDNFSSHSDIDMVIKGLRVEDFFKAHAFLLKESKYEIDLKPFEDLKEDFKEKILTRGMKVG
jgi:predicted nucleotidyltransferase